MGEGDLVPVRGTDESPDQRGVKDEEADEETVH